MGNVLDRGPNRQDVPGHGRAADSVGGDQSASGLTAGAEAL